MHAFTRLNVSFGLPEASSTSSWNCAAAQSATWSSLVGSALVNASAPSDDARGRWEVDERLEGARRSWAVWSDAKAKRAVVGVRDGLPKGVGKGMRVLAHFIAAKYFIFCYSKKLETRMWNRTGL